MKKSIRLFTFMLAAVLAACAFAGCGGNEQPANPTPDANEVLASPNIYNELLNASSAQFLRINSDGQQNGEPIVIRDEETFKTEVLPLIPGVNGVGTGDMAAFLGIISLSLDKYDPEMPVNILSVPLMTDKEKEQ